MYFAGHRGLSQCSRFNGAIVTLDHSRGVPAVWTPIEQNNNARTSTKSEFQVPYKHEA